MDSKEDPADSRNNHAFPLLADEDGYRYYPNQPERHARVFPIRAFLVHLAILITYTIVFIIATKHFRGQNCHESKIYTPAREGVYWERAILSNSLEQKDPYNGPPSPEIDAAWAELLKNSNIRISAEDLRKINRTSIQLADGSGDYFGGLGVHHHLHCVKMIRQAVYQDYYNSTEEHDMMWIHIDHCLEDLRQAVICNPDLSIYTYDWIPSQRKPWPNFVIDSECVNWEMLDGWAGERAFSLFDRKSLVHPTFGLAFPGGDN